MPTVTLQHLEADITNLSSDIVTASAVIQTLIDGYTVLKAQNVELTNLAADLSAQLNIATTVTHISDDDQLVLDAAEAAVDTADQGVRAQAAAIADTTGIPPTPVVTEDPAVDTGILNEEAVVVTADEPVIVPEAIPVDPVVIVDEPEVVTDEVVVEEPVIVDEPVVEPEVIAEEPVIAAEPEVVAEEVPDQPPVEAVVEPVDPDAPVDPEVVV